MNSNNTIPGQRPYPPGSVKAARERMEALKRSDGTSVEYRRKEEQRAFQEPRVVPSPRFVDRLRQPSPAVPQVPKPMRDIRGNISRPIPQSPQWPLNDQTVTSNPSGFDFRDFTPPSSIGSQSSNKFARPNLAPPMFEPVKQDTYSPRTASQRQISQQYSDAGSSFYGTPLSPPTRALSETSSMGSIPDFPIPQFANEGQPKGRTSLGPPPSARRAPPSSSFYTNMSYVQPIPEESERARSRASYASSSAMPSRWSDESPGSQFGYDTEDPFYNVTEGRSSTSDMPDEEDDDTTGLVRSASVGTRSRPKLVTTQTVYATPLERNQNDNMTWNTLDSSEYAANPSITPSFPFPRIEDRDETYTPTAEKRPPMPGYLSSGTDYPLSPSGTIPIMLGRSLTSDSTTLGKLAPPRMSALFPPEDLPVQRSLSGRFSFRKQSKLELDIDAVRVAQNRGSLTSLPGLVRRTFRLASMLEKNDRPASRLNDLTVFNVQQEPVEELSVESKTTSPDTRRTSTLSKMISAFPPPGAVSNVRASLEKQSRTNSPWPEAYAASAETTDSRSNSRGNTEKSKPKSGRRCCGLPLWLFLVLLLILLLIIAATVIIPLELLVFNKKTSSAMSMTSASPDLTSCQSSTTCANGGTVSITDGVCTCVCIDGFTGSTCTTKGSGMCMAMPMNGTTSGSTMNITLGSAVDRVILSSQPNFTIPLNAILLASKFAAVNLSCTAQNALIKFDGSDGQSESGVPISTASSSSLASVSSTAPSSQSTTLVTSSSVSVITASSLSFASSSSVATRVTGIVPDASASPLPTRLRRAIAGQQTDIIPGQTIAISIIFGNQPTTAPSLTVSTSLLIDTSKPVSTPAPTTFTINIISAVTTTPTRLVTTTPISSDTAISSTISPSCSTTSNPQASKTTSSLAPKSTTTSTLLKSAQLLDFARVITLFVFQQQTFDAAVSAQTFIQTFFNGAVNGGFSEGSLTKAGNVSIGNGNSVDFMSQRVFLVGVNGGTFGKGIRGFGE